MLSLVLALACSSGSPDEYTLPPISKTNNKKQPSYKKQPSTLKKTHVCTHTHNFSTVSADGIPVILQLTQPDFTLPLLIEIIKHTEKNGDFVLYSLSCKMRKQVHFSLPVALKDFYIVAFADRDGNGPSSTDPAGRSEKINYQEAVNMQKKHLSLSISFEEKADLSPLQFPFNIAAP